MMPQIAHARCCLVSSMEVPANVCAAVAVHGPPQQTLILRDRLAAGVHGQCGLARLQRLWQALHLEEAKDAARKSAPVERLQLDSPVISVISIESGVRSR